MIEPYLTLNGNAIKVMEYYEKIFDGTGKDIMRFKDAPPDPSMPNDEASGELLLHGSLMVEGTMFHFGDSLEKTTLGDALSFVMELPNSTRVVEIYKRIVADGESLMAPDPTFFSPMFAMAKDKFGISWQLVSQPAE